MTRAVEMGRSRLWTEEELQELGQRILEGIGERAKVGIGSRVKGTTEFARGDVQMVTEEDSVVYQVSVHGAQTNSNRIDDEGIEIAIQEVKAAAADILRAVDLPDVNTPGPRTFGPRPKTFFESTQTAALLSEARAEVVDRALGATEAVGLIGAGDLSLEMSAGVEMNTAGGYVCSHKTYGEFSLTVRTKDGTGSGWGWSGHEDWNQVDPEAVITRAIDLAQRSANPVAVEPGRYTVILEPTAVAPLIEDIQWTALRADQGRTPFSKEPLGTNKIGLQMLDRRLGITTDPWDPDMPRDNVDLLIEGINDGKKVWFDKGVLRDLYYDQHYATARNREPTPYIGGTNGMRLFGEGPTETLEEMIASTKRGIWVNRLSGILRMNEKTDLRTGTTRDGTFLIENGKITKAIKNFRFNESPFFILNKLEAVGEPVRAARNIVAPRVKVRDFNFTSLTDAI